MCVHISALVWGCEILPPASAKAGVRSLKTVAAKMADHAKPDGSDVFPSVNLIKNEAALSRRTVKHALDDLEQITLLIVESRGGKGPKDTTKYRFNLELLISLYIATQLARASERRKPYDSANDGRLWAFAKNANAESLVCKILANTKGANTAPKGADSDPKGASGARKGADVAPEPSLNHQSTTKEFSRERENTSQMAPPQRKQTQRVTLPPSLRTEYLQRFNNNAGSLDFFLGSVPITLGTEQSPEEQACEYLDGILQIGEDFGDDWSEPHEDH